MKKYILLLISVLVVSSLFAQFDVKGKIKSKATNRADQRIEEGIDKGIDKIEEGVGKLFKKKNAKTESEEEQNTESEGTEEDNDSEDSKAKIDKAPQTLEGFSKYDFVPGDKVLYFEDFSQDAIGDFPALWTTNGGGEVKTVNIAPGNWFHMNKEEAVYCYSKPIAFPENFIMEFDVIPDEDFSYGYALAFYEDPQNAELTDDLYPGERGIHINFEAGRWQTRGYNSTVESGGWIDGESTTNPVVKEQVNHVIIWVQNRRVRIYHQGAKVFDMPTNIHTGTKFNRFRFSGWSTHSFPYVSNLKITTAAPDTRSKLITEGKLVTYGIYFDVNKDVVKPESYGTLNDIAKVLKENPTVRVKIVGHTDADGADAANLDLSKRRGESVKNELVKTFGIEASQIESDGQGETKPIAPNDTPANKALNRRVEFLKI